MRSSRLYPVIPMVMDELRAEGRGPLTMSEISGRVNELDIKYMERRDRFRVAMYLFSIAIPETPNPNWHPWPGKMINVMDKLVTNGVVERVVGVLPELPEGALKEGKKDRRQPPMLYQLVELEPVEEVQVEEAQALEALAE